MERKIILIITLLLICISKLYGTEAVMHFESYNCSDHHGNYTEGSVYQHNMNTLFNNFSSQTPSRRFYNSTFGDFPNKVYGLYQCREGMVLEICSQCIKEATQKITEGCRLFSEGIVWFDECVLRYANRSIFSLSEVNPSTAGYYEETVSNYDKLRPVIEDKFSSVIDQAVRTTGQVHFGSTYANYTPTDKVYLFAQCTPDIDSVSCKKCLKTGLADIYAYYNMSKGVTTFYPSCQLGYDTVFSLLLYLLPPPTSSSPESTSVPAKVKSNYDGSKRKVSTKLIMAITIPVVIISICAIIILAFLICTNKTKIFKNYKDVPVPSGSDIILLESLHYDIATLQSATDNFSKEKKLGEGGFGSVYQGTLPNGQEIAVKRLSKGSYQGVQEFSNEVLLVTKLEHRNLVRILGFCLADEEKLLVYEYVANKSLDYHLFDIEKHRILNWETRYQIIAGIARGMLYLHKDSRLKIIHRDLKPSNVLLDEKMNPKISDFGMARIFCMDQTGANTSRVVGTYGYMAPEYALRGQFSDKSDVYSFGVLVLEIISGQRNSSFNQSEAVELLSYAWKKWRDGKPLEFVDSRIKESCSSNEVLRCMQLGLLCVQEIMNDRPTMETAVLVLHSNSYTLPMPQEPIFYNWGTRKYNSLGTISPYNPYTKNSMPLLSTNDLSVSEIYPR